MTKMKLFLPVSKKEAWKLLATPKGLASWFPTRCKGRVQPGRTLEFQWPDGTVENHRVLSVGDANSIFILDWWNTGTAFYLHGREPTHLTLQVTYARSTRIWQGVELVGDRKSTRLNSSHLYISYTPLF